MNENDSARICSVDKVPHNAGLEVPGLSMFLFFIVPLAI